jgi:energy-coupling factor transporter ATP-binding protein EcfA2
VSGAVWLITGAQASGKSTVAHLLASRLERAAHIRGGQFYRWVVKGWVHFDDASQPDEARRLLDLRYRLSARTAVDYAEAGFDALVQDNIYGPDVEKWLDRISVRPRHLVVLRPSIGVVEHRDAQRRRSTGKIAYRGDFTVAKNDEAVAATRRDLGLWLDTSAQTPEQTVTEILGRRTEAIVD